LQLGISSWSLPWSVGVPLYPQPKQRLDAFGLIAKAADHGVDVLQIADNLPLHELSGSELDRLTSVADAQRITLEVGTRSLEPEHLVKYIVIAHELGARTLRTVLSGKLLGADAFARAQAGLREVVADLERRQVTLALENNEAFSSAEFASLVESVGSTFVGICLDTANSLGRPETLGSVLENLAPHAVMLHAKDYDIQRVDTRMGFSVVGRPVGGGLVDFDSVLSALRGHTHDELSVIIEHWPPFVGEVEATVTLEEQWLDESIDFLQKKL
jgi:3-oxoisoapionate decarboxylase